ncbi:hypothetical protein [Planotetraspora sp. GP83]
MNRVRELELLKESIHEGPGEEATATREECLECIVTVWTDPRPLSLR